MVPELTGMSLRCTAVAPYVSDFVTSISLIIILHFLPAAATFSMVETSLCFASSLQMLGPFIVMQRPIIAALLSSLVPCFRGGIQTRVAHLDWPRAGKFNPLTKMPSQYSRKPSKLAPIFS